MGLEINEIRERITANDKRALLNAAQIHQNRIKFHTQTELSQPPTEAVSQFLSFVHSLIPDDKYRMFTQMFRYPVKTNEVTGVCFVKLSKIFDGRNPAFNYQFSKAEAREDWDNYRKNVLNEPEVWQTTGWEFFKTEINSVLVVDMPSEPKEGDKYPQPYFYWLRVENIINYEVDAKTGLMSWIIFNQDNDRIAVIDDERYRVFASDNGEIGELLIDNPHDLGFCPARFFWNEALNLKTKDIKKSPITEELEALDWYLFSYISKRNLDLYASYPIYSGYEQSCNYKDAEGRHCDCGVLKDKNGNNIIAADGTLMKCPKCGNRPIAGVGSFVQIPIPNGDKQPDLRNPVQILTVDRNSLDYNVEEVDRQRLAIITAVVGTNENAVTKEAINEKQIQATFESQNAVLLRIKKGFEDAQKFVDDTICKLRYGADFISSKINYGTDFYILDASELREQYKSAKEAGASESELDALQNQIIETEYRNNPLQLQRMQILAELEPYRHQTRAEALELFEKGVISAEDLQVKLNFSSFVRRFERENINIIEFATEIPFNEKIDIINKKIRDYVSQDRKRK